jgi:molybdopterin molybdotransferase
MRKFDLLLPADALAKLHDAMRHSPALGIEDVPLTQAHGRVIATDISTPTALPEFDRSTVDGFAVRAADLPAKLRLTGEVRMGEIASVRVNAGEAVQVHTGGNIPVGADAVVMVEQTTRVDADHILATAALSAGDNIICAGEDVRAGDVVINAGTRLREAEIGGLAALGKSLVRVVRQPRVAIIASGDEVIPLDQPLRAGQVRNINSYTLSALVRRCGGVPIDFGILPDQRAAFDAAAARAMSEADMIVFMAGSSMSERDYTPDVVATMGAPGILVHGIAFRPGKPTLFALCDGKPVFGLPGNPISALITAMMFVEPTLWRMQGALNPPQPTTVQATLTHSIQSPRDLEHWFPVGLEQHDGIWFAKPMPIKSNLIFGLVRANGIACAPNGVSEIKAGATVTVRLL